KIKCECGHENPEGTVLCESCGKPIEGNQSKDGNENEKLLNMRYEGSARRSKTYNTRIVDRIWTFFSSVKVGVWLIALTLIASILGTLFPQAMFLPTDAYNCNKDILSINFNALFGNILYIFCLPDI